MTGERGSGEDFEGMFTPPGSTDETDEIPPVEDPTGASQEYPHTAGKEYGDGALLEYNQRHPEPNGPSEIQE